MSQFETMSLEELIASREEIDSLIDARRNQAKNDLLSEFQEKAERLGLDISDLVGGKSGKKKSTSKVQPKYRNPSDASQTWSGRGRKPKWIEQELKNGRKIEDFAI